MRSTAEGRRMLAERGTFVLGRVVIAGARTRRQVARCIDWLTDTLAAVLGTPVGALPAQMCNIVAEFDTCTPIDLARLSGWVSNSVLTDEFPGLHVSVRRTRDGAKVASCNIFATGRVVVLGQKDEASTANAVRIIMLVLRTALASRSQGGGIEGYSVQVGAQEPAASADELARTAMDALFRPLAEDVLSARPTQ